MNILQIEDDIKSLPDTNLMEAMQTGSYPQYLVLSELKRRKDMRDDHAGRMASYDKNNTVALARDKMSEALDADASWIDVASQDEGLDWRTLRHTL